MPYFPQLQVGQDQETMSMVLRHRPMREHLDVWREPSALRTPASSPDLASEVVEQFLQAGHAF